MVKSKRTGESIERGQAERSRQPSRASLPRAAAAVECRRAARQVRRSQAHASSELLACPLAHSSSVATHPSCLSLK